MKSDITLVVKNITKVYDFLINGVMMEGFREVESWEGFTKFIDEEERVLIAFQTKDNMGRALELLLGSPDIGEGLVLVSLSPSILEEVSSWNKKANEESR